jgi:hypothetical protein
MGPVLRGLRGQPGRAVTSACIRRYMYYLDVTPEAKLMLSEWVAMLQAINRVVRPCWTLPTGIRAKSSRSNRHLKDPC